MQIQKKNFVRYLQNNNFEAKGLILLFFELLSGQAE